MRAGAAPKEPPVYSAELTGACGHREAASQTNHKTRGGGVCWSPHEPHGD
jgi:hypothetical protein